MQKARRHYTKQLRPLVSVWFQVLFHPLTQGTFHLSLTVLVHYRSLRSIQPYRMVPANSDGISPVPPYSGYYQVLLLYLYRTFTFYGRFSQIVLIHNKVHIVVLQPPNRRNDQGLGCSAFARHYLRNHYYFLFLRVLRCFSSPGWPPYG